ncbi:MAG: hypothetical protein JNJ85_02760, partial [Candidatus Kapabacteria bacterium]|nr:hypothetical protein [Candidatus Kapabacteria bacterium]
PYSGGQINGEWIYYYENGNISMRGNSINGINIGVVETYYASGKLWSIIPYNAGKMEGTEVVYYESGRKKLIISYKNGKEISRNEYEDK